LEKKFRSDAGSESAILWATQPVELKKKALFVEISRGDSVFGKSGWTTGLQLAPRCKTTIDW